jgi:hypothetical protein
VGTYYFKNIPQEHPMAILNANNDKITYEDNNSPSDVSIYVSGGNFNTNSYGDFYTFKDSLNNNIGISDGSFKFVKGTTYNFYNSGISSSHPFAINNTSIGGINNVLTITIEDGKNYSYICTNHSIMTATLTTTTESTSNDLQKTITNTTSDGTYNFYYGDVKVTVTGNFGMTSVYCYYHGYMGGKNLLVYKDAC